MSSSGVDSDEAKVGARARPMIGVGVPSSHLSF